MLGLGVEGVGCRVYGVGCGVLGVGCRVQVSGFRLEGLGLGFGVERLRFGGIRHRRPAEHAASSLGVNAIHLLEQNLPKIH